MEKFKNDPDFAPLAVAFKASSTSSGTRKGQARPEHSCTEERELHEPFSQFARSCCATRRGDYRAPSSPWPVSANP